MLMKLTTAWARPSSWTSTCWGCPASSGRTSLTSPAENVRVVFSSGITTTPHWPFKRGNKPSCISRLMWSHFNDPFPRGILVKITGYCYHSANDITFSLDQSDHIKRLHKLSYRETFTALKYVDVISLMVNLCEKAIVMKPIWNHLGSVRTRRRRRPRCSTPPRTRPTRCEFHKRYMSSFCASRFALIFLAHWIECKSWV